MEAGPRSQTIAAARAAVKDLGEQLQLALTKNTRRKNLYKEGAISREQLDESSNEVSVLKARIEEGKNKLDELSSGTRIERIIAQRALIRELDARIADVNLNIAKSTLKAPFNSRISVRRVDEGSVISTGESILRLVEMENLEVRIGLPTDTAYRLRQGGYQNLTIADRTYRATVESILPEVDSSTRTVTVVLKLETSPQAQVAVGRIARLELTETIRESGYWLPVTSLAKSVRGLWSCYVLEESSEQSNASDNDRLFTVKQEDVEVLYVQGNQMLVRGTLQPNDLVILNGSHRFVPGQLVRQSTIK
ncbi:MAG: HlyD family efflux transporter periplasmic adaptor subunit [Moorea sp. SIO4A3]|nr:HlyD family efflux transporter periplasmic adaptor subunit [Moorena sp. SIO4A3]